MKTYRLLLFAAVLTGSAAVLSAGPDARFFSQQPSPAKASAAATIKATPATTPVAVTSCATCACCKKTS